MINMYHIASRGSGSSETAYEGSYIRAAPASSRHRLPGKRVGLAVAAGLCRLPGQSATDLECRKRSITNLNLPSGNHPESISEQPQA